MRVCMFFFEDNVVLTSLMRTKYISIWSISPLQDSELYARLSTQGSRMVKSRKDLNTYWMFMNSDEQSRHAHVFEKLNIFWKKRLY